MDHFNITVQKDGAMVSTRRGLQVSKQKYNGISFVNTSGPAQPRGSTGTGTVNGSAKPKHSSSSSSLTAATPSTSSFSAFSTYAPGTTNGNHSPPHAHHSSADKGAAGGDPSKPLVHRWKLVTKPATGSSAKKTNGDAHGRKRNATSTRRGSPTASETSSSVTASTPSETSASFGSPLSSPPESTRESSIGSDEHSPPTTDGFSPHNLKTEFILPSDERLDTKSKRVRVGAARKKKNPNGAGARDTSRNPRNDAPATSCSIAATCKQVVRSLPTWSVCYVPQLSKAEQRTFHQYFQLIPRKIYPFEDLLQYNPTRSSEFYWSVVQDRAAVRCVLLCGSMFRAVLSGSGNSEQLAQEIANVCRVVNEQLAKHQEDQQLDQKRQQLKLLQVQQQRQQQLGQQQAHQEKRKLISNVTLQCVATLALMGSATGRYDHWHVHMRALRKMVDMNGGDLDEEVQPALVGKMRKTDLKGAMALATYPYLPFTTRKYANVSEYVLLDVTRQETAAVTATILSDPTCGVRPAVVETMGDLCVFVQAAELVRGLAKTPAPMPLHPHSFTEELHWIQYRLVTRPSPLRRDDVDPATANAVLPLPVDTTRLETQNLVSNHKAPLAETYLVPAILPPGTTALEPALRICGMLYLKEYFPDFPRNLGGYSILLHLLRYHLSDSSLHLGASSTAADGSGEQSLLANPHARALILWMCLVGDCVSRVADNNEHRVNPAERYDRRVFRDRLVDLVISSGHMSGGEGLAGQAVVNGLPDSDWAMCRLLFISKIQPPHEQDVWDDRQGVLNIFLGEEESK